MQQKSHEISHIGHCIVIRLWFMFVLLISVHFVVLCCGRSVTRFRCRKPMLMLMHRISFKQTTNEWQKRAKMNKNTNLSSFASQNNEPLNEYIRFPWFGCISAIKLHATNKIDFVKIFFFSCSMSYIQRPTYVYIPFISIHMFIINSKIMKMSSFPLCSFFHRCEIELQKKTGSTTSIILMIIYLNQKWN